ncbi:MAG: hypothetical protein FJ146_06720 [Deltaproteobacteria bacterium]|nr:hypothetical protein [Deltaproteobacteria bacterium]
MFSFSRNLALIALASPLLMTGCISVGGGGANGGVVPSGCLYTSVNGPIAPGVSMKRGKFGKACGQNVLGVVGWGDNSISTAQKSAGIEKIASVDYELTSILGVYAKVCTEVRGE